MARGHPLTLVSPLFQICARTMGAALVTGPRLTSLPRMACGTLRRQAPSAPAQGFHSKSGPPRPVPLKKRGYDVTRNPHLNKVMVRVWKGRALDPVTGGKDAPPPWAWEEASGVLPWPFWFCVAEIALLFVLAFSVPFLSPF